MRLLAVLILLINNYLFSANCTWNGNISSDWGTAANWSCNLIPGVGDNVTFNNATAAFMPQLNANRTVNNFTISAGTIDIQGFILTTANANIQNCIVISNSGQISGTRISQVSNAIFNGALSLTKAGGTADTWNGGNTFNGSVEITNSGSNNLNLANVNGDSYNSDIVFNNFTTGNSLTIARSGTNIFTGNVTVNNSSSATVSFGALGGTSEIANGSALLTSNFSSGTLNLTNLTQQGNTPNGNFNPTTLTIANVNIGGNFSAVATGTANIQNSVFGSSVSISGARISQILNSVFGNNSGDLISLTKTGATEDTWSGENIFNGNTTITNSGTNNLRLANVTGDVFNSNVVFNNFTIGNSLTIARSGTNTFSGNVSVNNTSTATVSFGAIGGTSEIASGRALLTSDFSIGTLNLTNVSQLGNSPNGSFNPTTLVISNSIIGGDFNAIGTGNYSVQNSSFLNNVTLSGGRISQLTNSIFGTNSSHTILLTKTAGTNDTWSGNNTFNGLTTITNSGTANLTLANTTADNYNTDVTFNNFSPSNGLNIARSGINNFYGNITTSNTSSGNLTFGANAGEIHLVSSIPQTIISTNLITIPRLTVNKPSGSLTMNASMSVSNTLNLNEGSILLNGNLLRFSAAAVTVNRINGLIISEQDGASEIQWNIGNTAGTYVFPFGKPDGTYIPVTYQQTAGNAGNVTISTYATPPNNTAYPSGVTHINNVNGNNNSANLVDRFWNISRSGASGTANITFSYADSEIPENGNDNIIAQRWSGNWLAPTGGQSGNSVTTASLSAYVGTWSLSRNDSPLPIEIIHFNVSMIDCLPFINWVINASEQYKVKVEYAHSLERWNTLFDEVINEKSMEIYHHDYPIDVTTLYYRIATRERNSSEVIYSKIISVNTCDHFASSLQLWPNPTQDFINIKNIKGNILITDINGKTIKELKNITEKEGLLQIDVSQFAKGLYILYSESGTSNFIIK